MGNIPEFYSRNLKAPHYQLRGTRQKAMLFDSRHQQTLVFETTEENPHIGRLTAIEDRNGNRIAFIYDGIHLRRVEHSDGAVFFVTTTGQGYIKTVTTDEGGVLRDLVRYEYTPKGELASVHGRFSGEFHYTYSWDKSGRLIGVKDNKRGTSRFSYDPRDQIEHITRITGLNKQAEEHYRYDAVMNLVQSNGNVHRYEGGTVKTIGPNSYRYDMRGRTIEKKVHKNGFRPKTWRFTWDDFDRLIETRTPDGSVWKYTYDAFGRRIRKECDDKPTTYCIWQGSTLIEEWRSKPKDDASPLETTRWHFEPGTFTPIAKEMNGTFYPIVTDHLGTPKELFDTEGKCLWQAEHALWGRTNITAKKNRHYEPIVDCNLRDSRINGKMKKAGFTIT